MEVFLLLGVLVTDRGSRPPLPSVTSVVGEGYRPLATVCFLTLPGPAERPSGSPGWSMPGKEVIGHGPSGTMGRAGCLLAPPLGCRDQSLALGGGPPYLGCRDSQAHSSIDSEALFSHMGLAPQMPLSAVSVGLGCPDEAWQA